MVFHPVSNGTSYEVVPGSIKSFTLVCHDDGIRMVQPTLLTFEAFIIQRGDIIAVCLPRQGQNDLRVITRKRTTETKFLYEYDPQGPDDDDCEFDREFAVNSEDLEQRRYLHLHLYPGIIVNYH